MSELLNKRLQSYYSCRGAYEACKKVSDGAYKDMRDAERELIDYMIENGIKKLSFDDGTTPILVSTTSISVTQETYEQIREWLRETVGDDKDFLVTLPHKPTILEHVKKMIANGEEPPAFLKVDTRPTLRIDGWKGRDA